MSDNSISRERDWLGHPCFKCNVGTFGLTHDPVRISCDDCGFTVPRHMTKRQALETMNDAAE